MAEKTWKALFRNIKRVALALGILRDKKDMSNPPKIVSQAPFITEVDFRALYFVALAWLIISHIEGHTFFSCHNYIVSLHS